LRDELKIAIYEISLKDIDLELDVDLEGVYTWQNDRQPLLLIRKITSLLTYTLQLEWLKQINDRRFVGMPSNGEILWAVPYSPEYRLELSDDDDIIDSPTVCTACSR